jgi:hypothetical protein
VSTVVEVLVIAWNDGGGPGWQLALGHVTAVALAACGVAPVVHAIATAGRRGA